MKRIKLSMVPAVTLHLLKQQGGKCALCEQPIGPKTTKRPALDHDHGTGYLRGILCVNCNGIEGKIHNLARRAGKGIDNATFLRNIVAYWEHHAVPQHGGVFHYSHKTPEEKRLLRLAKAKAVRAKRKILP